MECSNKLCGNTAYFSRLHEVLDDKATLQSFMMYLKNILKLDYDFDKERKKNKTEFHRLLEATSIPSTYAFLQQLIESDDLQQYRTDDYIHITPKEMLSTLNRYCRNHHLNCNENGSSLKLKMLKIDSRCHRRIHNVRTYILHIQNLERYLKDNKYWTDLENEEMDL